MRQRCSCKWVFSLPGDGVDTINRKVSTSRGRMHACLRCTRCCLSVCVVYFVVSHYPTTAERQRISNRGMSCDHVWHGVTFDTLLRTEGGDGVVRPEGGRERRILLVEVHLTTLWKSLKIGAPPAASSILTCRPMDDTKSARM